MLRYVEELALSLPVLSSCEAAQATSYTRIRNPSLQVSSYSHCRSWGDFGYLSPSKLPIEKSFASTEPEDPLASKQINRSPDLLCRGRRNHMPDPSTLKLSQAGLRRRLYLRGSCTRLYGRKPLGQNTATIELLCFLIATSVHAQSLLGHDLQVLQAFSATKKGTHQAETP